MDAQELIERVMTEHWDFAACPYFFCKMARSLGFRPRDGYPTNPATSILSDRWIGYGAGGKANLKPEYQLEQK
jgi:hypothetical protein